MDVVKLSSVLTAVPVLFLLVILAISTVKWLREDFGYDEPLTTNKYDNVAGEAGKAAYVEGTASAKNM
jgi:BCCT family betaine/carnitine transporter